MNQDDKAIAAIVSATYAARATQGKDYTSQQPKGKPIKTRPHSKIKRTYGRLS